MSEDKQKENDELKDKLEFYKEAIEVLEKEIQWFSNYLIIEKKENTKLRAELEKFANTVDESLLLDEDLHKDWQVLRNAVVAVRKLLEDKK